MSELSELKKNLKTWENDFFKEHLKKPDKNDIQMAPKEVKEWYSKYFQLKKSAIKTPISNTAIEKDVQNTNKDGDVWGVEFNKKTTTGEDNNKDSTPYKCSSFLDKISDRMFQNSKSGSAKKYMTPGRSMLSKTPSEDKVKPTPDGDKYNDNQAGFPDETETFHKAQPLNSSCLNIGKNMSPEHESDIIMSPFSGLKNSAVKIMKKQKQSVSKENHTQSKDSDIPMQFSLPSKPRLSFQSIDTFKQKADMLRTKIMEDGNSSEMNTDVNVQTKSNDSYPCEDIFGQEMSVPTIEQLTCSSDKSSAHVDIVQQRPTKQKSNLQKKLEQSKDISVSNYLQKEDKTTSRKPLNRNGVDEKYIFEENFDEVDKDDGLSPKKVKVRKRKTLTSPSSNNATNKRQRTGAKSAVQVTSNVEDNESVEKTSAAPRRAVASVRKGNNENFVRLNMKAKRYKKKGGQMTGSMYKRKQWKMKMQAKRGSNGNKCFICGLPGHWANKCPEKGKQDKKYNYDPKPVDESDFLSLKEAAMLAKGVKIDKGDSTDKVDVLEQEIDIEAEIIREDEFDKPAPPPCFEPMFRLDELRGEGTPKEMKQALKQFGFQSFRPGQETAMKRILCGQSTLVVLSTGEGKSLCYQLPAFVYAQKSSCLTLVVSPLVSLMEDQVSGLPRGVQGACIHSNMTNSQKDGVFAAIADGNVHFLLISPEAVVGGAGSSFGSFPAPNKLPPIAFVCIDEAHCLSEWSHNFRPSYLRLTKVLREVYGVKCFLGLTATATKSTAEDVAKHLGIAADDDDAVIRGSPVPKNLLLSVSRDLDKDQALINLLQGERFSSCHSIIIYCTRREQANRVATYIRTCLQKKQVSLSQRKNDTSLIKEEWSAECYHAGLTPAQRKRVQKLFMTGKLRVVVATVAFGMGLDKSDVRAVIHYNMPKSFESYVQEIGRAGRDRQLSHCHLFLDPEGKDLNELRKHTHGNTVDRYILRKLLQRVFQKCRCKSVIERQKECQEVVPEGSICGNDQKHQHKRMCRGHERALCVEECIMTFDIREEGIYTLLCYLELHPQKWIEILPPVYTNCKIKCYGGPSQLQTVSKKCPPLAVAIARKKMEGEFFATSNSIEFSVVEISDSMGWNSGLVKRELKQLQWTNSTTTGGSVKTGVMVELCNLGFHFTSPGDLTDDELDEVLDFIYSRVKRQEKNELYQLDLLEEALRSVSSKSYWMCADDVDKQRSDKLKKSIEDFFDASNSEVEDSRQEKTVEMLPASMIDQFVADVRLFYNMYGKEHALTGRAITRIFHGIGSPCFPVETWCRVHRFWRSHLHVDFNLCLKYATQELVNLRR